MAWRCRCLSNDESNFCVLEYTVWGMLLSFGVINYTNVVIWYRRLLSIRERDLDSGYELFNFDDINAFCL